ncbi:hypothetical protein Sste5346_004347 [Sporothrix stenoceras]|uniref:Uncharacterized protein n=1 Tax=Sporothrix stenoceras TaxID=5173 RepID=A0ABR3ZA56_9PEZI
MLVESRPKGDPPSGWPSSLKSLKGTLSKTKHPHAKNSKAGRSLRLAAKCFAPGNGMQNKKKPKKSARSEAPEIDSPTTASAFDTHSDDATKKKKQVRVIIKKKNKSASATLASPPALLTPVMPPARKKRIIIVKKSGSQPAPQGVVADGKLYFNGKPASGVPLPSYTNYNSCDSSKSAIQPSPTASSSISTYSNAASIRPESLSIVTPPTSPEISSNGLLSDKCQVKTEEDMAVGEFGEMEENTLLSLVIMIELAVIAKNSPHEAKGWGLGQTRIAKGKRNKSVTEVENRFMKGVIDKKASERFAAFALWNMARGV